jgi:acyl-CoA reductase-like NAD-dependent aldehyde dehydrogenase
MTVVVRSPGTGAVVGEVAEVEPGDVAGMVAQGHAAQPAWSAAGFRERSSCIPRTRARRVCSSG